MAEIKVVIITFMVLAFIQLQFYSFLKLTDRVAGLEALVKLLENEIKAIHEKENKNG